VPKTMTVVTLGLVVGALVISAPILAQSPPAPLPRATRHHAHQAATSPSGGPTLPGQDAFGAIAEIVRLLEADPTTD
jgi:hypothetical protein